MCSYFLREAQYTKILEGYLSRYIQRQAISKSRVKYCQEKQMVQILFNDYTNQKEGQAAPKATKDLPPVEFINQFMQHCLPRYFQKSRHHGLHSPNTRRQYEADWDETMKRPSQLIKTLVQILKELLQKPPFTCEVCKGEEYQIVHIYPDKEWKYKHIRDFRPHPPPPLTKTRIA